MHPSKLDPDMCQETVPTPGLRMGYHQCLNPVRKDGFCTIHHPDYRKKMDEERSRRYEERWRNSPIARLGVAVEQINGLKKDLNKIGREMDLAVAKWRENHESIPTAFVNLVKAVESIRSKHQRKPQRRISR